MQDVHACARVLGNKFWPGCWCFSVILLSDKALAISSLLPAKIAIYRRFAKKQFYHIKMVISTHATGMTMFYSTCTMCRYDPPSLTDLCCCRVHATIPLNIHEELQNLLSLALMLIIFVVFDGPGF